MDYQINEQLREEAVDFRAMTEGIEHLKDELEDTTDPLKRASILSLLGVFNRITEDYIGSVECLQEAYDIFKNEKKFLAAFVARLRLGVTLQWKKDFIKSEKIFLNCIEIARNSDDPALAGYEDFAIQHIAKCKFDQGFYNEALEYFTEAMELRIVKGDLELIKVTERAIEVVRSHLPKSKSQ